MLTDATPAKTSPSTFANRRLRRLAGLTLICLVVLGVCRHIRQTGQLPFLRRESVWSIAIYAGPTPFNLTPVDASNRPVLTAQEVTDVPALFVADPFMVRNDDRWYMFMEVLNLDTYQGDIGLATSADGLTWSYEQIVIDEPFHMSYPSVFQHAGTWYMVPETEAAGCVRLYEAIEFPYRWRAIHTLVQGPELADPTLFRHADRWWMFVGRSRTHDRLQLFHADNLLAPWIEHPLSPLISDDPEIARPGGPVVAFEGDLYRLAQDCSPRYGNQLRAFRITTLTVTEYAEEPIEEPILTAGHSGWNDKGMHHNDPHRLPDGSWRSAVDGHTKLWKWQFIP